MVNSLFNELAKGKRKYYVEDKQVSMLVYIFSRKSKSIECGAFTLYTDAKRKEK